MSDTTETMDMSSARSSVVPCAACRSDPTNAHRIRDLEQEVRLLRDKATAAADKLADYEEELQQLKGQRTDSPVDAEALQLSDGRPDLSRMTSAPEQDTHTPYKPSAGRFSFLSSRKALPAPPPSRGGMAELEAALARETHLREEAEKKAANVENEIEELSATLFEQANEMVSTERRARAELEEKLHLLEQKDKERSRRLDRIEEAMRRVDRVKMLLMP